MTAVDPAFKAISKTHTGFHIWRIENMQVVPVTKSTWGSFYDGDSYIIYAASEYGKPAGVDAKVVEVKGTSIEIHIHFWLGTDTSQDEAGVAAYKTVELDDYLGGMPSQHREAQGYESGRFKAYFPNGITLLHGGVESGFNTVTDDFQPKLFHVKGRKNPTCTQMPSISWEHFNDGDVFILDTKEVVFLWIGKYANSMEKLQSTLVASRLRDDHGASALVFVDDGDEMDMHTGEKKIFNSFLKLSEKKVKSAEEAGADDEVEEDKRSLLTLYQCNEEEDGTYQIVELKSGPLYQSELISDASYIIDNGTHGCWVWIGKRTSQKERVEAVRNAQGFVTKKGYPATTPVTRVVDGGEPTEFKVLFSSWKDKDQSAIGRSAAARFTITVTTKLDAATLYETTQLAADNQLWDDGTGTVVVWRLRGDELEEVKEKLRGLFFAGDTYVIEYSYWANGAQHHVVYHWLGQDTQIEERNLATEKAIEKGDEVEGGGAVHARVNQGKEPPHFLTMFQRGILIFNGGYQPAEDGDGVEDSGIPKIFLLHVEGNRTYNTRAFQVELTAASLNSNHVFVLKGKNNCFVWCGKGSTGDEREMGKTIAEIASKGDFAIVSEGQEKDDFWEEIGGKQEYVSEKRVAEEGERLPPRLFHMASVNGKFKVEEIFNFNQSDLVPQDMMVLDINDTVYIWVGKNANEEESKRGISLVIRYLKRDPKVRDVNTPVVVVRQGFEPPTFTGFFSSWDPTLWDKVKTFEQMRLEIEEQNPEIEVEGYDDVIDGPQTNNLDESERGKYPLQFLQETGNEDLPEDVDKLHKELHLSGEDFVTAFGMDYQTFSELPAWKQLNLKKAAHLF